MTPFTYLVAAVALACWITSNSLIYVADLAFWLPLATGGSYMLLVALATIALFRRRWLVASVCLLTVLPISLHLLKVAAPLAWIQRTGFRLHASPIDDYLSHCKLLTISEDNKLQQVGQCASLSRSHLRIDVIYDTSGTVLWPTEGMSPGLKTAAAKLFSAKLLAARTRRVHIFGSFYAFEYADEPS